MGKTSYRFVINGVGKNGETYFTHCRDKNHLKKWITDNQQNLLMSELKIIDKKMPAFLKLFSRLKRII